MLLTAAEFVLPGHPDKLCDASADALVQEAARRQKRALCHVEVAVHRAGVLVTGRIACRDAPSIDVPGIVRDVFAGAGHGNAWPPAPEQLAVHADLRLGPLEGEERRVASEQAIATGYAVDLPGANYLPAEHWLAWRLARRLHALRSERPELRLGPDGRVLVVLAEDGEQLRLEAVTASLQQAGDGPEDALRQAVRAIVQAEVQEAVWRLGGFAPHVPGEVHVHAACGPLRDTGLSGKQVIADCYGPRVPGGALSGKDFFPADRAGAVIARRLARAVVQAGAARACTASLVFFPGQESARLLSLRDEQGRALDGPRWSGLFDLSLAGCGERWTGRADLVEAARWGHFTGERPWEVLHFDRPCGEEGT